MFAKSIVAVALLAGFSAAQNSTSQVDVSQIPLTTRAQWCAAQQNACPELCGSASLTAQNGCDAPSLTINCTCTNGSAPGLQYYINTVPTFLCEELHTECKTNNAGNANAQKACDQAEQANCGKLDPSKYSPPSSSSSSATSGSPSATATNAAASSGTAPASSTSKAAAPTMAISRELGTGIFAAGAAAAFGLMI